MVLRGCGRDKFLAPRAKSRGLEGKLPTLRRRPAAFLGDLSFVNRGIIAESIPNFPFDFPAAFLFSRAFGF